MGVQLSPLQGGEGKTFLPVLEPADRNPFSENPTDVYEEGEEWNPLFQGNNNLEALLNTAKKFCAVNERDYEIDCDGIKLRFRVLSEEELRPAEELLVKKVIRETRPSVVSLYVSGKHDGQSASWLGSGYAKAVQDFNLPGYQPKPGFSLIKTNHHVANGAEQITVRTYDGRSLEGTVLVMDEASDSAIIEVETGLLPIKPLPWERLEKLEQGDTILAFGQPLGLTNTITKGMISAFQIEDGLLMIQIDAAINPGNSGGPSVNLQGRVIGMNTSVVRLAQGGFPIDGIAFVIPEETQDEALRKAYAARHQNA